MNLPVERLVPWTLARSIWASQLQLLKGHDLANFLLPRICSEKTISFGQSGLAFKDNSLVKAAKKGFAIPQLSKFLRSPFTSTAALRLVIKVGQIHQNGWRKPGNAKVLLSAALEATVTYMNFHPGCVDLFVDHPNSSIGVGSEKEGVFMTICRINSQPWALEHKAIMKQSTATLIFSSDQAACFSAVGNLDHMLAAGDGQIQLRGQIPLLEKFGYASRVVRRELPSQHE